MLKTILAFLTVGVSVQALAADYSYLTIGRKIETLPSVGGATRSVRLSPRRLELNKLIQAYNVRFGLKDDEQLAKAQEEFVPYQETMINKWKSQKAVLPGVTIRNDYDKGLVLSVSPLRDELGGFMGFLIEQNKYADTEQRSLFRVLHAGMLRKEAFFLGFADTAATSLKIQKKTATGADIEVVYLTDLKQGKFDSLQLQLVKKGRGWEVRDPQADRPVRNMFIDIWTGFLNGGVEKVLLDSRDGCVVPDAC